MSTHEQNAEKKFINALEAASNAAQALADDEKLSAASRAAASATVAALGRIETARQMAASAADPSLAEQAFQDVLAAKKGVRGYTP